MNKNFELIDHATIIAMGLLHLIAISVLSNKIGSDFYKILFYSDFVTDEVLASVVNATAIALAICSVGWIILVWEKIWKHLYLKKNRS